MQRLKHSHRSHQHAALRTLIPEAQQQGTPTHDKSAHNDACGAVAQVPPLGCHTAQVIGSNCLGHRYLNSAAHGLSSTRHPEIGSLCPPVHLHEALSCHAQSLSAAGEVYVAFHYEQVASVIRPHCAAVIYNQHYRLTTLQPLHYNGSRKQKGRR